MPESPDLSVVADALHAAITGRSIECRQRARAHSPSEGRRPSSQALVGQEVRSIRRRGKFLLVDLDRDAIAINPMLTGRLQLATPGDGAAGEDGRRPRVRTADPRPEGRRRLDPRRRAGWSPDAAPAEVRYKDPTQMGKVYLRPAGVDRPIPGLGEAEQGPDADDPALTLEIWRDRIRRHPGELKNLLRNQSFVAGIGNAYSDEILHAAGLLPFRKRSSLATEEVDTLYQATRETLASAVTILRERVPPTFEKQVRDFLAVHDKGGQPCPRCGTRITEVKAGGFITSYCRGCQH